jgi:DNA-binding MarR family transcriptional regulator
MGGVVDRCSDLRAIRYIGIDDAFRRRYSGRMRLSPRAAAQDFIAAFGAVFLRFHRRGPKRSLWTPQSWAVLQHLELAGPLTVTEAAKHMARAQSVMSEIIDGLERKGLLARMRDARDRRRTLVWLTDQGRAAMAAERQVLDAERLESAFAKLGERARRELLHALHTLVAASAPVSAADDARPPHARSESRRRRTT